MFENRRDAIEQAKQFLLRTKVVAALPGSKSEAPGSCYSGPRAVWKQSIRRRTISPTISVVI